MIGRTVPGNWLLANFVFRANFFESKWIRLQSQSASDINHDFLDWLGHRPEKRPFFAYLNYFDAHEPYIPPVEYAGRFGIRPQAPRDYDFLFNYNTPGWKSVANRDVAMARDCYDDCIAFLDEQLGQLLDTLQGQGLLENTLVIMTSDHGESFGDHGLFLHGTSLYFDETAVPLVILSPDAPANRVVSEPVSLRDLPATVLDKIGLSAGSPFPGHSLAAFWSEKSEGIMAGVSPALSEHATETAFVQPEAGQSLRRRDVQMSLVARGRHYIRDGFGKESLYDVIQDPFESVNLIGSAEGTQTLGLFRQMLLHVLTANPGSIEAENAYLGAYRQWLHSLVQEDTQLREPISATPE